MNINWRKTERKFKKSKHTWNLEIIYKYPEENQEKRTVGFNFYWKTIIPKIEQRAQKIIEYDKIIDSILLVIKEIQTRKSANF